MVTRWWWVVNVVTISVTATQSMETMSLAHIHCSPYPLWLLWLLGYYGIMWLNYIKHQKWRMIAFKWKKIWKYSYTNCVLMLKYMLLKWWGYHGNTVKIMCLYSQTVTYHHTHLRGPYWWRSVIKYWPILEWTAVKGITIMTIIVTIATYNLSCIKLYPYNLIVKMMRRAHMIHC